MKTRTLGKDFTVSAVGLGCMGMSHGYGQPKDVKDMTELLAKAVDAGYTFSTPPKSTGHRTILTPMKTCWARL